MTGLFFKAWNHVKSEALVKCFPRCGFQTNAIIFGNLKLNSLELEESLVKEIESEIGTANGVIFHEENVALCQNGDENYLLYQVIDDL